MSTEEAIKLFVLFVLFGIFVAIWRIGDMLRRIREELAKRTPDAS